MGITSAAYYKAYKRRNNPKPNSFQKSDEEVMLAISEIYHGLCKSYGKRKIKHILQVRYGETVSLRRVARLMRKLNLRPRTLRAKRKSNTTILKKASRRVDYLNRDFNADEVNKKWVTDISYIYLSEAKENIYFTSIIDLCSRKVLAWKISKNQSVSIVTDLLVETIKLHKPDKGLIVHSDQGSQYTSYEVEGLMKEYGIVHSFSRPGCPQDNAVIESFHSLLKGEHLHFTELKGIKDASIEISTYINWYNNHRIHESLGYRTPSEAHEEAILRAKEKLDEDSEQ